MMSGNLTINRTYTQEDYTQNQKDARSQNMMTADVALSAQDRKANAVAS